ncbi:GNAT family N-acetyltransferase [Xanthobacter sp. TB0139]|uniref:GNAT family N-acetyltransferase n=1 Tax=Xanthobacter sp. TB0139 TaxID=3459178 RepID=UPI004038FE59
MPFHIRAATSRDEPRWRELWAGYNRFYEAHVPPDVTNHTWHRILDPSVPMFCLVAEMEGDDATSGIAGFCTYILHEGSWVKNPVCYLEDLFVDPACRGQGLGRALIQELVERGRAQNWSTLYWHTRTDNPARKLYDSFTQADDFVRYRLHF